VEMSAGDIDELMELWTSDVEDNEGYEGDAPFHSYKHLYDTIDATKLGDAPWQRFSAGFDGPLDDNAPSWKKARYDVWYRDPDNVLCNMLDNPDFKDLFDCAPYIQLNKDGKRRWSDFMSGNFSWRHSVSELLIGLNVF
jgi:hypothetical protein